jgi:hypothetical protein
MLVFVGSTNSLEAIKQSYMQTVNELNEELLAMKEAYDQLDRERQGLITELQKRPAPVDRDQVTRTPGMRSSFHTQPRYIPLSILENLSSNLWNEPFREVCLTIFLS